MKMELEYIWKLWLSYKSNTPSAAKIQEILQFKSDEYFNDHIAFRTINIEKINKESIAAFFEELGWVINGSYHFKEKKLDAIHLEHKTNKRLPKIFISELLLEEMSSFTQQNLKNSFQQYQGTKMESLLHQGRKHDVSYEIYQKLAAESEYASWLYVYGFQPNHFTVYINNYKGLTLQKFTSLLVEKGIALNESGGVIKGSKEQGLIQASTMADNQSIVFNDLPEAQLIPSCYVEFAERFELNGELFEGFITDSADKIFESTYQVKKK